MRIFSKLGLSGALLLSAIAPGIVALPTLPTGSNGNVDVRDSSSSLTPLPEPWCCDATCTYCGGYPCWEAGCKDHVDWIVS